jgi:3-hydroxyisobutyrate dehydrogenase-like beta-hydroxyacid dehydrogenase
LNNCIEDRLVGNAFELGMIELLSESFTLADQAGVGSAKLMELIHEEHNSPSMLRYARRITENRFDSEGGFNLGGGIADARSVKIT